MAAALAHELSQPLAAVSNSANAARRLLAQGRHQKIDTVREIMDEIAGQALRAGQILRRLRDFVTRGESERQLEDVQRMVEEASDFTLIGSKFFAAKIRFKFAPDTCNVFVNRIQIQQVLVNIMRNALEAMTDMQQRELSVSTIRLNGETMEIAVADSGPGLLIEIADRLFEPFVSSKHDGMGLGLSISRSIVEAHGGILRYEPNPGGGAIFRFTLPCAMTEEINVP
jgi:C4-dicarboxylate-specific signal transduction histidine kinase